MAKFLIGVREMHIQYVEIEADNAEDAKDLIRQGEGTERSLEYSCTTDTEEWTVNKIRD